MLFEAFTPLFIAWSGLPDMHMYRCVWIISIVSTATVIGYMKYM